MIKLYLEIKEISEKNWWLDLVRSQGVEVILKLYFSGLIPNPCGYLKQLRLLAF